MRANEAGDKQTPRSGEAAPRAVQPTAVSPLPAVSIEAPAKLNLFLEVLGRRPDGYHELVTAMQRVSLADQLVLRRLDAPEVRLICDAPGVPADATNLAARAASAALEALGWPGGVEIALHKRVPHGAGLGGGSSDAASALLGVEALFGVELGVERRHAIAAQLGSDVQFFLVDGLVRCGGRGTDIEASLPGPRWAALLLVPALFSGTPVVYRALSELPPWTPCPLGPLWDAFARGEPAEAWARHTHNRLEDAACQAYPALAALRDALRARWPGVRLTGSGSAWFVPGETAAPPVVEVGPDLPAVRAFAVFGQHARPVAYPLESAPPPSR